MKLQILAAAAVTLGLSAGPVHASGKAGGIKFGDKGEVSFKLGGRIQWDLDHFDGVYAGETNAGDVTTTRTSLRRARLELSGTVAKDWGYAFNYNINNNTIDQANIKYLGFNNSQITVGKQKEPIGLEELTSSKWISTAERSMFWDSSDADSNNFGVLYHGWSDLLTWSTGLYRDDELRSESGSSGNAEADRDDVWAWTSRFTVAPIVEAGNVVHFGLAYSARDHGESGNDEELINARAGISADPRNNILDVNASNANGEAILAFEALWISGPFSAQFEYFARDLDTIRTDTITRDQSTKAWYLLGTWTLTGESRSYKRKSAHADKIKPKGEGGAWELVLKLDNIEADLGIPGAATPEVQAVTLGVNWYANKNVKMMLNYTSTSSDNIAASGDEDSGSALLFRSQLVF